MLRILIASLMALFFSSFASPAFSTNWNANVEILDASHAALSPTRVGQWYPVILLGEGAPYSVNIHNPLDERVRVVISIDGLNPFTGRRSMMGDGGMVLGPGERKTITTRIPGRKSPVQPLTSPARGDIHKVDVAFFRESPTMPRVAPNMKLPPPSTHPDKWVPPSGTAFYPRTQDPEIIVHRRIGPTAPSDPL